MATMPMSRWIRGPFLLPFVAAWLISPIAAAQKLSDAELIAALEQGGYVLVLRNARSSDEAPAKGDEAPANLRGEREIDAYGQGEMAALSYSFRELGVPVGKTLTSPAYRSRQSAAYFGFGEPMVVDALAEPAAGGDASWLEQRVTETPPEGQNTVIVTHGSLISEAFGSDARNIRTAEMLVYRPRDGGAELAARLTIEDWAKLAVD